MKTSNGAQPNGGGGTTGAVYIEFLIAFMPLFVFFMSLVQLAYVEAANIVVEHAAVMAARAAIVVLPDDPAYYDYEAVNLASGARLEDIKRAARVPLRSVMPSPTFEVSFPRGEQVERDGLVEVQVDLLYKCLVPVGRAFVCSPWSGRKKLSGRAAMPNQGAGYEYADQE
jgi:hypothetical protein